MSKRVSWELVIGDECLYFDRRWAFLERLQKAHTEGHPLQAHRWEWPSGGEPASTPLDVEALLAEPVYYRCPECGKRRAQVVGLPCNACQGRISQECVSVLAAPVPRLPMEVWLDVARALSDPLEG
jgi:hypothetical protein